MFRVKGNMGIVIVDSFGVLKQIVAFGLRAPTSPRSVPWDLQGRTLGFWEPFERSSGQQKAHARTRSTLTGNLQRGTTFRVRILNP